MLTLVFLSFNVESGYYRALAHEALPSPVYVVYMGLAQTLFST